VQLPGPASDAILRAMRKPPCTDIYLSPHLDDVVYSCGATIYGQCRAGRRVLVVSLFSASPENDSITPFARELKERWGNASDPVAERRQEDLRALALLGAEALHLDFLDCVYRQDPRTGEAHYPNVESIFGDVHEAEAAWHVALLGALRSHLAIPSQATFYAPLTVGHHVDHILVQRMAIALLRQGQPTLFYEDYPYAGDMQAIERTLSAWPAGCWQRKQSVVFDEQTLDAKVRAAAAYVSQISTFWADISEMRQALAAQALSAGRGHYAENYWSLARPCW
jgi:LmbE family N-acetylglucosaminyl deacetylase